VRIATSAEEKCQCATRNFFEGPTSTGEVWNIDCSNGQSFAVTVDNSGGGQVLACDLQKAVSKVECLEDV